MNRVLKQYMYYLIIGIVSFIALAVLPFLSSVDGELAFPSTKPGWILWVFNRVVVSVINIMLFYCFTQQGEVNVQNNEKYVEAQKILLEEKDAAAPVPRSPKEWKFIQYRQKGTSILTGTLTASVALTQMLISFDKNAFISYFMVIFMGIVFGVLQMKNAEDYWTNEFYKYALKVKEENEEKKTLTKSFKICYNNTIEYCKKFKEEEHARIREKEVLEPTGTSASEQE